ncbi:MAG: radical SAM protein [Verrucomicrobiae bacterium]|nr:radical SAM protein [Verrucomicrobiae bacterium]
MAKRFAQNLRMHLKMGKIGLRAFLSTKHPILVHLIPMRKCNLECAYCNEYDKVSSPVPSGEMFRRVDKLAELGSSIISISGGEPLLHPDLDRIIERIGSRGMQPEMITNGYLLNEDRIKRLNEVGLARMQISIDNVLPDKVSKKSLKVLDKKLVLMARHAAFAININSVIGAGVKHPEDAITIARRARELGFSTTLGIIHDECGRLRKLNEQERSVWKEAKRLRWASFGWFYRFQDHLAQNKANKWRCRAGARFLYICEDGLVHYCSQQRGNPGIPLSKYTKEHIEHAFNCAKPCAPFCTISCVHTVAAFDSWRRPQYHSADLRAEAK